MDRGGWEILRIKKKTKLLLQCLLYADDVNMLGECIHTVAAEKHRNFISSQYGDLGQDFIVSRAIHYGLDGPRIESRWGQNLMYGPDR